MEEALTAVQLARLEGKLDAHAARSEERFDNLEEKLRHGRNNTDQKFIAIEQRVNKTADDLQTLKVEVVRIATLFAAGGGAFTLIVAFATSWFGGGGVHH